MQWEIAALCTTVLIAIAGVWTVVRRIEGKVNKIILHLGLEAETSSPQPLSEHVKAVACDPNKKIQAIKAYREETGVGLAEAKKAVEEFINGL